MKISVITPSFNSGDSIEVAILSVLAQTGVDYEHIIVDGGSSDNTLDILKRYPHLTWISEPDNGQVDAMKKGFRLSSGEILVYLNADDYFLPGTFSRALAEFEKGAVFVVGDLIVEKDTEYYVSKPKSKLWQMLRHWEQDAFPYNPVAYFYKREVQENIPFNDAQDCMMDLEFLLEVASTYTISKVDSIFGGYRCLSNTKTIKDQKNLSYWTEENFKFIEKHFSKLPEDYLTQYLLDRSEGYKKQREWQAKALGIEVKAIAKELQDSKSTTILKKLKDIFGKKFYEFPSLELPAKPSDKNPQIVKSGSSVTLVYQMGKVGSSSIFNAIRSNIPSMPCYQVHYLSEKRIDEAVIWHSNNDFQKLPNHIEISQKIASNFPDATTDLKWKIITLFREPVSLQASICFQNLQEAFSSVFADPDHNRIDLEKANSLIVELLSDFDTRKSHFMNWFDYELRSVFGIDIFEHPFDKEKGYHLIKKGNIEVLVMKYEILKDHAENILSDFFDRETFPISSVNIASEKKHAAAYKELVNTLSIPNELLDRLYSANASQHFYSADEIQAFKKKWSK